MSEWNPEFTVKNFGLCRAEQFEKMRSELGLSLPDGVFSDCVNEYSTLMKRDPTVGELRLLDRLFSVRKAPGEVAFTQIDTNDASRAATYADLMEKRRELRPGANTPILLEEAFTLATAALLRGGKPRELPGAPLLLEDARPTVRERTVTARESRSAIRFPAPEAAAGAAREGDVFLLIRRGDLSPHDYRKRMEQLVADDEFLRPLRRIDRIDDRGVLPFLLSVSAGLYIDLGRLCGGREASPELLTGELEGDWLALLPKAASERFLSVLSEKRLSGAVFAAVIAGAQTVLVLANRRKTVFRTAFLRSLCSAGTVSAVLRDEDGIDPVFLAPRAEIPHCRYLPSGSDRDQVVPVAGVSVSASAAAPVAAPYRTALLTALAPVLALSLAGADHARVRYAVDLALPDGAAPGDALSAVLGVYRAQTELGIPAAAQRLSLTAGARPSLTVFAVSEKVAARPARLTTSGAGVYLVTVPLSADGLPDFAALRAMLADLSRLAPLSARVIVNEPVTDALRKMRTTTLSVRLSDRSVACEGAIPLGVLLESDEELPFARIGSVVETATAEDAAVPFVFPSGNGMVWRERPEAVVLASAEDADAPLFATRLADTGAAVSLFRAEDAGPLSRAVLTASAVFVLSGASLPDDPQVAFALQVLTRDGGIILSLGESDGLPETVPHRHFPNGISL